MRLPPLAASVLLAWLSLHPALVAGEPAPRVAADVHRRLAETGAPVKVWVFFADKALAGAALEAALAEAEAALPARTAARRSARGSRPTLVDESDLPVAGEYLRALEQAGAQLVHTSRWLNAASALVDGPTLQRLAVQPFVQQVRLVGRSVAPVVAAPQRVPARGASASSATAGAPSSAPGTFAATAGSPLAYGLAQEQVEQIDADALHALGYTGEGIVIGVLDSGFDTSHEAFHQPGHGIAVLAAYDFVDDDPVVGPEPGDFSEQHVHGTLILGTLAAYFPDDLVGVAPDATYVLCKTEDVTQEVQGEEDNYVAGLEFAEFQGADVATSSLGYIDWYTQADLDGQTAVATLAVNAATANGLVCVTAAGNAGHDTDPGTSTLIAPSDAARVVTVGAVDSSGAPASFTSDGPTADGRTKPEVVARGVDTYTVWPYDDEGYAISSGTSLSTPLVAGVLACLVQARPDWTVDEHRSQLIHFAGTPAGLPDPLFVTGFGLVDGDAALQTGTFTDLGGGAGGTSGTPQLTGDGNLTGLSPLTLTLQDAPPSSFCLLWISLASSPLPALGGTVHTIPLAAQALLTTDAGGGFSGTAPFVPHAPAGTALWFQVVVQDGTTVYGLSLSNGLQGVTP